MSDRERLAALCEEAADDGQYTDRMASTLSPKAFRAIAALLRAPEEDADRLPLLRYGFIEDAEMGRCLSLSSVGEWVRYADVVGRLHAGDRVGLDIGLEAFSGRVLLRAPEARTDWTNAGVPFCPRCGYPEAAPPPEPSPAVAIVERHRRHVELSPGVGADVQRYALAVLDDVLADLARAGLTTARNARQRDERAGSEGKS